MRTKKKKRNNNITQLVRQAAVLPLIPQHLVEDIWPNILEDQGEADNISEVRHFLWNNYQTEGPSTSIHLEGWHNKIKKVQHVHPNIYQIIELLQKSQAVTECTIIQYAAGGAHPPKRRRY